MYVNGIICVDKHFSANIFSGKVTEEETIMSVKPEAVQTLKDMAEKKRDEIMNGRAMRDLNLDEIKEVNRLNQLLATYRAAISEMTEDDEFITMYPDLKEFK